MNVPEIIAGLIVDAEHRAWSEQGRDFLTVADFEPMVPELVRACGLAEAEARAHIIAACGGVTA